MFAHLTCHIPCRHREQLVQIKTTGVLIFRVHIHGRAGTEIQVSLTWILFTGLFKKNISCSDLLGGWVEVLRKKRDKGTSSLNDKGENKKDRVNGFQ